jgi:hypothetical protein
MDVNTEAQKRMKVMAQTPEELDNPIGVPLLSGEEKAQVNTEADKADSARNSPFTAAGVGLLQGTTLDLGLPALVKSGIISKEKAEELQNIKDKNAVAAAIGEIGGIAATAPISLSPVGAVTKVGEKIASKALAKLAVEGGSVAQRIVAKGASEALGSSVMGAAMSTGQLLNESALGRADFNAESMMAAAGTGAIFGAIPGAIVGGATGAWQAKQANKALKAISNAGDAPSTPVEIQEKALELLGIEKTARVDFMQQHADIAAKLPEILVNGAQLGKLTKDKDLLTYFESMNKTSKNELVAIAKEADEAGITISKKELYGNFAKGLQDIIEEHKNIQITDAQRVALTSEYKKYVGKIKRIDTAEQFESLAAQARSTNPSEAMLGQSQLSALTKAPFSENLLNKVDKFIQKNKSKASFSEVNDERMKLGSFVSKAFEQTPGENTLKQTWGKQDYFTYRKLLDSAAASIDDGGALASRLSKANENFHLSKEVLNYLPYKVAKEPAINFGAAVIGLGITSAAVGAISPAFGIGLGTAGLATLLNSRTATAHAAQTFLDSDFLRRLQILHAVERNEKRASSGIAKAAKEILMPKLGKAVAPGSTAILLSTPWAKHDNGKKPENKDEAINNIIKKVRVAASDPNTFNSHFQSATGGMDSAAPTTKTEMSNVAQRAVQFLAQRVPQVNYVDPYNREQKVQLSSTAKAKFENYLHAIEKPLEVVKEIGSKQASPEAIDALRQVYPALWSKLQVSIAEKLSNNKEPIDKATRSYLNTILGVSNSPASLAVIQKGFVASRAEGEGRKSAHKIKLTTQQTETQRIETRK